MSFLKELQQKKSKLKATETIVTYVDGTKCLEVGKSQTKLSSKSCGFVIDTKPDTVPACILENQLYLGSQDSVDMNNINIYKLTHILSIGIESPFVCDSVIFKFIPCLDLPETNFLEVLELSNKFISDTISAGGIILVHCNAGVSRSAAVCIAYLICCKNLNFNEAYSLVKSKRECIQPNVGFVGQLKTLSNVKNFNE